MDTPADWRGYAGVRSAGVLQVYERSAYESIGRAVIICRLGIATSARQGRTTREGLLRVLGAEHSGAMRTLLHPFYGHDVKIGVDMVFLVMAGTPEA